MSAGYARIAFQTTKGNKQMENLTIGQTFTTTNSGVTGTIKAVDNHPSGVARILLDVNGAERWTSVSVK
jgi:preprotein translocase subunit YajC